MRSAPSCWLKSKGCPMTDILVRICVGLNGFMLFVGGTSVIAENKGLDRLLGGVASILGLITILRALGVL